MMKPEMELGKKNGWKLKKKKGNKSSSIAVVLKRCSQRLGGGVWWKFGQNQFENKHQPGSEKNYWCLGDTKSISRLTGPTDPDFVRFEKIIMLMYYRKTTDLNRE